MMPWLTVIGVGLDGAASLSQTARSAIESAELVAGSTRLLDLIEIAQDRRFAWPSPMSKGIARVKEMAGRPVVVLATGDPMHFGVGSVLAAEFKPDEFVVLPAPSSLSLAAARMGWALQDVVCISLHGRPIEKLYAALAPNTRLLLLTRDGAAPADIMHMLRVSGYGGSQVSVLENLGGSDEARCDLIAKDGDSRQYAVLNIIAVQCVMDKGGCYLPLLPGMPDSAFVHDGQLTKRDVRAITLSALAPTPGETLWDVGAGCGSIAIEWLRGARGSAAVAFERNRKRCAIIEQNAGQLGVPHLTVVAGTAPDCLEEQPVPDVIFLGGALSSDAVFQKCWQTLRAGGRLVANAVTLEGQAALAERHRAFGGELLQIAISHAKPVGQFYGLQPAMAVTQWRAVKL